MIDKEDEAALDAFREMLTFYGLQLQSHASMILGLALLLFGIVQAWGQLSAANLLKNFHAYVFSSLAGVIGAGIVYEALRLYVYGKLASALSYADEVSFSKSKKEQIEISGRSSWRRFLPLRKVSLFSIWQANQTSWLVKRKLINKGLGVSHTIEVFAFEGWFIVSYAVLFGGADSYSLFQYSTNLALELTLFLVFLGWVVVFLFWDRRNGKKFQRELDKSRKATSDRPNDALMNVQTLLDDERGPRTSVS